MQTYIFPDFFQQEDEEALRSQTQWMEDHLGLDDPFLAKLLGKEPGTVQQWRSRRLPLPAQGHATLIAFWQLVMHLLARNDYDESRVRRILEAAVGSAAKDPVPQFAPPWSGSASLKAYLETDGSQAIDSVNRWLTSLRFGDPYSAAER